MPPPTTSTAAAQSVTFNVEPFDPRITKWSRWLKRFKTAMQIYGIEQGNRRQYVLFYMGNHAYDILSDKVAPTEPEEVSFEIICDTLKNHFEPKPNEIVERYQLHLRKQKEGEKCEDFLTALRGMAARCNFGTFLESALRDQFVFGLRNTRVQSRLLEKDNLTLKVAMDVAIACESAEYGGVQLQ